VFHFQERFCSVFDVRFCLIVGQIHFFGVFLNARVHNQTMKSVLYQYDVPTHLPDAMYGVVTRVNEHILHALTPPEFVTKKEAMCNFFKEFITHGDFFALVVDPLYSCNEVGFGIVPVPMNQQIEWPDVQLKRAADKRKFEEVSEAIVMSKKFEKRTEESTNHYGSRVTLFLLEDAIVNTINGTSLVEMMKITHTIGMWKDLVSSADIPFRAVPSDLHMFPSIEDAPHLFHFSFPLYEFQKKSVFKLMQHMNDPDQNTITMPHPEHICLKNYNLFLIECGKRSSVGKYTWSCIPPSPLFNQGTNQRRASSISLQVRAQMLCDKTGMGKTVTTIAFVILQIAWIDRYSTFRVPAENGYTGLPTRCMPLRSSYFYKLPLQKRQERYFCNAALIVVPSHLIRQWYLEIGKFAGEGALKRVLLIDSVTVLKTLTYIQIMQEYDIILVSKTVFRSPSYRKCDITIPSPENDSYLWKQYHGKVSFSDNYRQDDMNLWSKLVTINHYATEIDPVKYPPGSLLCGEGNGVRLAPLHFRIVVIDEMHELDASWTFVERGTCVLQGDFFLGLTATPNLENYEAFSRAPDTGYNALFSINVMDGENLRDPGSHGAWYRKLFQQHYTMRSGELQMMDPIVHVTEVSQTAEERSFYMSIDERHQRWLLQFCSHHNLADQEQLEYFLRSSSSSMESALHRPAISVHDTVITMQQCQRKGMVHLEKMAARETGIILSVAQTVLWCASNISEGILIVQLWNHVVSELEFTDVWGCIDTFEKTLRRTFPQVESALDNIPQRCSEDVFVRAKQAKYIPKDVSPREFLQGMIVPLVVDSPGASESQWNDLKWLLARLRGIRKNHNDTLKKIREIDRSLHFYDFTFQILKNPDQVLECPLCLDSIPPKDVCLTVCGHTFCGSCVAEMVHRNTFQRCSVCRHELRSANDVRRIDRTAVVHDSGASTDDSKYGSKIARLMALLYEITSNPSEGKIVVCAQWDALLHRIGDALAEFHIPFVYVDTDARIAHQNIDTFLHQDETRIILLSLDKTVAGLNLQHVANHVVFVHPLLGDPEWVYERSKQAVGRIQRIGQSRSCHVHYLVTKNTIEDSLYNKALHFSREKEGK
jgi:SNF2-related domain